MSARRLGAIAAAIAAAACASAHAADWSCPEQVVGDGHASVRVELQWRGLEPAVVASAGILGTPEQTGPDRYAMELGLPNVAAPLDLVVSASAPHRSAVSCTVHVVPAPPALTTLHSDGPLRLSGPSDLALVEEGRARIVAAGAVPPPALQVTAGHLQPWTREADHWVAQYEPPPERFPRVVLFAAAAPDGELVDWLALPMSAVARVEAVTEPGASVRFAVGDETFGPIRTDGQGRATMVIRAPPGIASGRAIATDRLGNVSEQQVEVSAPEFQRVLALCTRERREVDLVAVDRRGEPEPDGQFVFEVEGATAEVPTARGKGHYVTALASIQPSVAVKVLARLADAASSGASCELPAIELPARPIPPAPEPVFAPRPLPRSAARSSPIALTPRLGYAAHAGALSTVVVLVDAETGLARWPWASVGAELGGAFSSKQQLDSTGTETVRGRYLLVPLLARATASTGGGRFALYAGPSLGGALVSSWESSPRSGSATSVSLLPSVGAHAGIAGLLGPGRWVAETTFLHGFAAGRSSLDVVLVTGGYRFAL